MLILRALFFLRLDSSGSPRSGFSRDRHLFWERFFPISGTWKKSRLRWQIYDPMKFSVPGFMVAPRQVTVPMTYGNRRRANLWKSRRGLSRRSVGRGDVPEKGAPPTVAIGKLPKIGLSANATNATVLSGRVGTLSLFVVSERDVRDIRVRHAWQVVLTGWIRDYPLALWIFLYFLKSRYPPPRKKSRGWIPTPGPRIPLNGRERKRGTSRWVWWTGWTSCTGTKFCSGGRRKNFSDGRPPSRLLGHPWPQTTSNRNLI